MGWGGAAGWVGFGSAFNSLFFWVCVVVSWWCTDGSKVLTLYICLVGGLPWVYSFFQ